MSPSMATASPTAGGTSSPETSSTLKTSSDDLNLAVFIVVAPRDDTSGAQDFDHRPQARQGWASPRGPLPKGNRELGRHLQEQRRPLRSQQSRQHHERTSAGFASGSFVRPWTRMDRLPESDQQTLRLLRAPEGRARRDLLVYLPLERQPVQPATFPGRPSTRSAQPLRPAKCCWMPLLAQKLRSGAGPFTQLRQHRRGATRLPARAAADGPGLPTVRLLIADDVGIGKTIRRPDCARDARPQ